MNPKVRFIVDMLSERIFFIIEGLVDIVKHLIQHDTAPILQNDILNLRLELSHLHDYLTLFDKRGDQPSPSDKTFFIKISSLADASDNILCHLSRNVHSTNLAAEICDLVNRIRNSIQVPSQTSYTFNTGSNINMGDRQQIGPTNLFLGPNTALEVKKDIRPKSYSHVMNCDIVGFKEEIENLVSHLMNNDNTQVVGIVGMAGSGKTTLVKQIYHHPQIKTRFALKVWVCISQSWNKRDILCDMLRQTKGISINNSKQMSDVEIVEDLSELFSSLSYLVVLDDIWDVAAWNDISPALPIFSGSKVIVTARKEEVPRSISLHFHDLKLKPLNDEESYELFCKRMYPDDENSQIKMQNKEVELILKKCGGLPLAITALAGVLRVNRSQRKWMRISERWTQKILNMKNSSTQGVVEEILALSYIDLPHYLKPCVLYLGIFPEDYMIKAELLIQLWIAECLIRCPQKNEESIAEEYLEELIERYIIQELTRDAIGQVQSFSIHDLIQQMIVNTANKEGFLEDSHRIVRSFSPPKWVKHSDDNLPKRRYIGSIESVLGIEKNSHARSLICINCFETSLSTVELRLLFQKFVLLRVLILRSHGSIQNIVIPEEIGNLIHLRYLELVGSCNTLPRAFENLQNLQTLEFSDFYGLCLMPKSFCKMKDLKHLYLPGGEYMVEGQSSGALNLDRLQNLKTLCNVRGGEWMFSEMPGLSPTLKKLDIREIRSERQLNAVICTPSILSNNLETLFLDCWCSIKHDGIENLRKCKSLRKMRLSGDIGDRSIMFPPSLVKLGLKDCSMKKIDVMEMIDKCCPQLEVLSLGFGAYKGDKLVCKPNSFPHLDKFMLWGSVKLKRCSVERGAMPNLKLLLLIGCRNLELTSQGWEFVTQVSKVACNKGFGYEESQFTKNLRSRRKDYLDPSQIKDSDIYEYLNFV